MAGQGVVLGYLKYVLGFDSLAFQNGLGEAEKRMRAAQKSLSKTADKFSSIGQTMTLGMTLPLAAFGTSAFNAASEAAELQSSFDTTFGKMSSTMNKWAETTGNAMGRSTQEMQKAANTFGIFFNTAVDPTKAAQMSQTFAKLAQDLGSFYNVDTDTAIEKLRSGLSGESEPLRDFGVFLTEASVSAKAMQMGLSGVGNELTEQEKIVARYALILDATKKAQGDVARTSAGTANQIRAAKAAFEELQVQIGTQLLPVITPLITKLGEAFKWFSGLPQPVQTVSLAAAGLGAAFGPLLIGIGSMASGFSALLPLLARLGPLLSGTIIPVVVGLGRALVGLAIAGGPITLLVAGATAVYLAWKNWDKIGPIVARLYGTVKTYMVDKLGAVWKWVGDKIDWVANKFKWLDDVVVRHSYIPDMVDSIGDHIARLDGLMVRPVVAGTEKVAEAFRELASRTGGILDQIFPEQALVRKLEADLGDLDKALAAKLIDRSVWLQARSRLEEQLGQIGAAADARLLGERAGALTFSEVMPEIQAFADKMDLSSAGIVAANDNIRQSFADTVESVSQSIQGLVGSLRRGDWLGALSGALSAFSQLGSAGVFGKGLAANLNNIPARADGGPVTGGRAYMVGERGPELFTASRSGYIHPNSTGGNGGRGAPVVQLVVGEGQMFEPRVTGISGDVSVRTVGAAGRTQAMRARQSLA